MTSPMESLNYDKNHSPRASLNYSNKASPNKDRLPLPNLDPKTQMKLFGRLSIQDVANTMGDSELGLIPGY